MTERRIHIEPTNRCTLACPQCPRTQHRDLVISDIDVDVAADICSNYDKVVMAGNHGDTIYHPRLYELISAIKSRKPGIAIHLVTNGAFRSEKWWQHIAPLFDKNDDITFSIDGLPHNNHLYRVNSKWPTIEAGIRTLRAHNPTVRMNWKWIIFKHNQHDIDQGMQLARSLGFNRFIPYWSERYEEKHEYLIPTVGFDQIMENIDANG